MVFMLKKGVFISYTLYIKGIFYVSPDIKMFLFTNMKKLLISTVLMTSHRNFEKNLLKNIHLRKLSLPLRMPEFACLSF